MYHLEKVVKLPEKLDLPTCMYHLEPLIKKCHHMNGDDKGSMEQDHPLAMLEKRQEAILDRLCGLKERLNSMQYSNNHIMKPDSSPHLTNKPSDLDSDIEMLPEGWEKLTDPNGRVYYIDHVTRSTFWELPQSLPPDWCMYRHPSGCVFYVNQVTGVTSWERPHENQNEGIQLQTIKNDVLGRLSDLQKELHVYDSMQRKPQTVESETTLEERRNNILRVIEQLRYELNNIRKLTESPDQKEELSAKMDITDYHNHIVGKLVGLGNRLKELLTTIKEPNFEKGTVHDLVISSHPKCPPYSILMLSAMFEKLDIPVFISNHVHSSITKVDENLKKTFNQSPNLERSEHLLAFTLQWKDVPYTTLMVNPLGQSLITMEVNIIRYISRLFPETSPMHYESKGGFAAISERDLVLDRIQDYLNSKNNKDKSAFVNELNLRLKANKYLMGDEMDLVDVFAWSAAKQNNLDKGSGQEITKWFKNINDIATIEMGINAKTPRKKHFFRRSRKQSERKSVSEKSPPKTEKQNKGKQRRDSDNKSTPRNNATSPNKQNKGYNKRNKNKSESESSPDKNGQNRRNKNKSESESSPDKNNKNKRNKNKSESETSPDKNGQNNGKPFDLRDKLNAMRAAKQDDKPIVNANGENPTVNGDCKKVTINANDQDINADCKVEKTSTTNFTNRDGLLDHFKKIGIKYQEKLHKEVFTVEAMEEVLAGFPGVTMKNLFLKDKKDQFYLLAVPHDAKVDLNDIAKQINVKKIRFASEDALFECMGVKQGSVSAYALINDVQNKVQLLLDNKAIGPDVDFVNFHPMTNAATLGMSPDDFKKFLNSINHRAILIST